jgi:hypothetical protein
LPTLKTYLTDGQGEYILQDPSDPNSRILVSTYEYATTGRQWSRIAANIKHPRFVRSFHIRKHNDGANWTVLLNRTQLVGVYPTQDACIQVVQGCFIRCGASRDGSEAAMTDQLSEGRSFIDDALNVNSLVLVRDGNDLVFTLSDIDINGMANPIVTWDTYTTPGNPGVVTPISVIDPIGGTQIFTVIGGYAAVLENHYIQGFMQDFGVSTISSSNVLLKDEVAPSGFSVKIGTISNEDAAPEATYDGSTYQGSAYAYPQWVSNDWPEGITPSYSYAWAYTIDAQAPVAVGGSGSSLNLALVPYGAALTCGAVATAYVNGQIATSTDPATQVAVAVTATSIGEVSDIKLFLTADPNGAEQTIIQSTTEYFAYAYDTNGTLLTDTDITWEFPGKLTAPSNVAFTLSGTEAVGETITASAVTYDGGTSTLVYSWNGTGPTTDQSTYLLDAGDEGTTVTLTVTASNNGGTSDGTATTGSIGPFVPTANWDTEPITYFYSSAGGVDYINNTSAWDTLQAAGNPATPVTTTTSGSSMRMGTPVSGGWNSDAVSTAFPHVYIWTDSYGWDKATQTTTGNNKPLIDHAAVNHTFAFQENLPQCAYAFYATDQGDISGWTAYDGPTA